MWKETIVFYMQSFQRYLFQASTRAILSRTRVLRENESGAVTAAWAAMMPVMIAGLAFGVDMGSWYIAKRDLQSATDASAVAAGYDLNGTGSDSTTLTSTATTDLARNGFSGGGLTITVNHPPATTTQPMQMWFAQYFMTSQPAARARAVAQRRPSGNACVLALDPSANAALRMSGSPDVNLDCTAAANSDSATAIDIGGNSNVFTLETVYTPGGIDVYGSATLTTGTPPVTGASPLADPYGDLANPSFSGCSGGNNTRVSGTVTLSPGVFCNGLRFNAGANVTMSPGTYYIDRGSFDVNGGATVNGTGVTIVLTSSTGSNYADTRINGGAVMNLSAPTGASDPYRGLLFYQDRRASSSNTNFLNGGSTTNFNGALYFPNQIIDFTGGNSSGPGGCTMIIGRQVIFSGNSKMHSECAAQGIRWAPTPGTVLLVE